MNIKGIYRTSLLDYPGKICTVLFSGGCNLRCGFCHNPELARNSNLLEQTPNNTVLEHLKKRKKLIDGVTLSGGEPTISGNIVPFTESLKELHLSVKLDTNGLRPAVVRELLSKKLLDYVAVDIKTSPQKYSRLAGADVDFSKINETLNLLKSSGIDYELRTTCIPGFAEIDDFKEIGSLVGRVQRYFLQQFVPNVPLLDQAYSTLVPYPANKLMDLKTFVSSFADVCEVRGI